MKIPEVIHIALGTDDKYCKYAGCCIASILLSAAKGERFCFYVVDNGISEQNKSRLMELQKLRPHELVFLTPDMYDFSLPQKKYFRMIFRKTPWRGCVEKLSLKRRWKRFRSTSVLYQRFRTFRSMVRSWLKRFTVHRS